MGREIRKVPPNWKHPETTDRLGRPMLKAMHDTRYEEARDEWLDGLAKWQAGERPSYYTAGESSEDYWEYNGNPPERDCYRPWADDEATWFQVWETVSEGTPVSPPFETEEELIEYLSANGDFWDQKRCREPDWASLWGGKPGVSGWGRQQAERFVKAAWAPSMIMTKGVLTDGKLAV